MSVARSSPAVGGQPAILPPLVRREQRHRRQLLLALAALIVLSLTPVFGHHLIEAVSWLPASQQHLGMFCLASLHRLLAPVHGGFHALLLLGISYATVDRGRAIWRHRRVMGALDARVPHAGSLAFEAARRVGVAADSIRIVEGSPSPAFTTGWVRPRVYLAADVASKLSVPELEAVLAHEAEHLRRRDPLRLFLFRCLAGVLFWLPAVGRLVDDLADEAEIAADDAAARAHALPLASAILVLVGASPAALEPAVGFQRADLLERRIRRLAGEDAVVGTHVSRRSIAAAGTALLAVWVSGVIVLHPLPPAESMADPAAHCEHAGASLLSHLFCRAAGYQAAGDECPHTALAAGILPST